MYQKNKMINEVVPYNEALALKKIGFDEPCRDHWERGVDGLGWGLFTSGEWLTNKELTPEYNDDDGNICGEFLAPFYQQVFTWFREKHNLHHELIWDIIDSKLVWFSAVSVIGDLDFKIIDLAYKATPHESELLCLQYLIEMVNKKI